MTKADFSALEAGRRSPGAAEWSRRDAPKDGVATLISGYLAHNLAHRTTNLGNLLDPMWD
jgi:hypothetical protein